MMRNKDHRRLQDQVLEKFSDRELRELAEREYPDLALELPGVGCSPQVLAEAFVSGAARRGYVLDVAFFVFGKHAEPRRRKTLTSGALAAFLGGALIGILYEAQEHMASDISSRKLPDQLIIPELC
jgi:hypothetical protein